MSSCDRLLTHFHSIYVFKTQRFRRTFDHLCFDYHDWQQKWAGFCINSHMIPALSFVRTGIHTLSAHDITSIRWLNLCSRKWNMSRLPTIDDTKMNHFLKKICVPDHGSITVILRATPFLSSVFSRSLYSPHQGPAVNRDIKILPPGPMLRCRQCCPSFEQPACFTVLPFCCVTHRCKCSLMIDNNATSSCNVSCVYQPLILTGKTFLVLLELCMASDDGVFF